MTINDHQIYVPERAQIDWQRMRDVAITAAEKRGEITLFHPHAYGASCNLNDGNHKTVMPTSEGVKELIYVNVLGEK